MLIMKRIKKESLQMNKVNNEAWKPYSEFDFIEISTMGRVRTLDRVVPNKNGKRLVKGHILKQYHNKDDYLFVCFSVNGKQVNRSVHRLVAQTFIKNTNNLPQVNHKDCNRTNNNVDNLEWCDASYNMQYREKHGVSNEESLGRPVFAVSLNTLGVFHFQSQSEASRALEVVKPNINMVIKGKLKQAGGYWFTNADDNAIEATRDRFDDVLASKVEKLMANKELQLA